MAEIRETVKAGLTSARIKWIALVFMTIDHLAAYGYKIPLFAEHYWLMRTAGRIAAPLFLFILTESARHTGSRSRFLLRLYSGGAFVGLFIAATNFFFGGTIGVFSPGNIIFTFFYTVLFIYILEGLAAGVKEKDAQGFFVHAVALVSTYYIPEMLHSFLSGLSNPLWQMKYTILCRDLLESFLPRPLHVEYSLLFILMGIVLYFARRKELQAVAFFLFCVLSHYGSVQLPFMNIGTFGHFFAFTQSWMVLALPFMFLYNGQRGADWKWMFYVYYPLHRYLISILQVLFY
jgi:hypothetical protein